MYPPPFRDKWLLTGAPPAIRDRDWVDCGGNETGDYFVDHDVLDPGLKASRQINYAIQRCMLEKGYRYTGPCNNEVTMAFPGCGAP